jgi:sugar-specific transcriptional regulator TrmB
MMNSGKVKYIDEDPKIPCSLPPEEVLERFVNELKHPINSIKGYIVILQKPDFQDQQQEAIANIHRISERMEELRILASDYLHECFDR